MVHFKNIYYSFIIILIFNSCLEDILNPLVVKFDNASDLITYVETRTQLLKGADYPVLVDADEVHQNLTHYLIIDLRTPELFVAGHIPGAINLDKSELIEHLKNNSTNGYNKIVLLSNTGQIACYAACLMIIAGYDNVCVLDRGMTYWHDVFSEEYKNAKGDDKWWSSYDWFESIKSSRMSQTTKIEFSYEVKTIEDKVAERIQLILENDNSSLSISASGFSDSYNPDRKFYNGIYLIYIAYNEINYLLGKNGRVDVYGPNSAVYYEPPWQFLAYRDLLTFRLDKNIVMYSPTGQISSFWQAYLNFLGYDKAVSIKYGSISIMGFRYEIQVLDIDKEGNIIGMRTVPTQLTPFFFDEDLVRNYEYETGP